MVPFPAPFRPLRLALVVGAKENLHAPVMLEMCHTPPGEPANQRGVVMRDSFLVDQYGFVPGRGRSLVGLFAHILVEVGDPVTHAVHGGLVLGHLPLVVFHQFIGQHPPNAVINLHVHVPITYVTLLYKSKQIVTDGGPGA